jgi:hypothetical protein
VFIGVAVWIAGWRKALENAVVSVFLCLLFGIGFQVYLPGSELPRILLIVGVVVGYAIWRKQNRAQRIGD